MRRGATADRLLDLAVRLMPMSATSLGRSNCHPVTAILGQLWEESGY